MSYIIRNFLLVILFSLISNQLLAHIPFKVNSSTSLSLEPNSNFRTSFALFTGSRDTLWGRVNGLDFSVYNINNKTYVSSNAIIQLGSILIGAQAKPLFYLITIPLLLTNSGMEYQIFPNVINLYGQINTDYYLFYNNSTIYSEISVGIKFTKYKYQPAFDVRYPIFKGYRPNNDLYYSITFCLEFDDPKYQ